MSSTVKAKLKKDILILFLYDRVSIGADRRVSRHADVEPDPRGSEPEAKAFDLPLDVHSTALWS